MPILASPPPTAPEPTPEPTQDVVDRVLAMQRTHCAPSTWDRFVKSLAANGFPFKVGSS